MSNRGRCPFFLHLLFAIRFKEVRCLTTDSTGQERAGREVIPGYGVLELTNRPKWTSDSRTYSLSPNLLLNRFEGRLLICLTGPLAIGDCLWTSKDGKVGATTKRRLSECILMLEGRRLHLLTSTPVDPASVTMQSRKTNHCPSQETVYLTNVSADAVRMRALLSTTSMLEMVAACAFQPPRSRNASDSTSSLARPRRRPWYRLVSHTYGFRNRKRGFEYDS